MSCSDQIFTNMRTYFKTYTISYIMQVYRPVHMQNVPDV